MRAVVQRVGKASVTVDHEPVGQIGRGLLVYLGIGQGDTAQDIDYLANKVAGLRIFPDDQGQMNRSVVDVGGAALVISQFTLYGDARRGRRPSFVADMAPETAAELYTRFTEKLDSLGVPSAKGIFGAMMEIHSVNDGPVTILLDSKKLF